MSEAALAEENPEVDASLGLEGAIDAGPRCEKCGLPSDAAACPRCGWYPSLGIHVEIDEAWESVTQALPSEGDAAAPKTAVPEWRKHFEVWRGLIPGWGWLMIGTTLGVVGLAVTARVATLANPTLQTYLGVGGLLGGAGVALLTHLVGFLFCSFDDADFGVTDVLIKPLKVWKQLASELPERLWLVNTGNAGLSTALAAALIVGGVPYERLLDWGIKARAKPNLVGAIAQRAAESGSEGADNLEGAVGDFAGQAGDVEAGAGGSGGAGKAAAGVAEKPRQQLDCLIIGYQADRGGQVRTLLLAADSYGRLRYVGKVTPELERKEAAELLAKLDRAKSTRPFVKCPESGVWVRPKFTCRATYTDWERGRRPENLAWDQLLDELQW